MHAFTASLLAVVLIARPLICAGAANSAPLTVLMDFEAPHSEASLDALRVSLNKLLSSAGFDADVRLKADLSENAQFGQLVVFKMKGSCSLSPWPVTNLSSDSSPLAKAYTSDGTVLHFGEVECDHVRRSLQRTLGLNSSLKNQQTFGSALAVVIAHEVYHMLGNARKHTKTGITKSALSSSELLNSKLAFPESAFGAMQRHNSASHLQSGQ